MRDNKATFEEMNMEIARGNNLDNKCKTMKKMLLTEEKQRTDLKC